jgi:hypothetical protein
MVITRKNPITISFTIHEFVSIQSRIFGRMTLARLPSRSRMIAGALASSAVRRTRVCHHGDP